MYAVQEGCRRGRMQERRDAGHEMCRTGEMQHRNYAGQGGCRTGGSRKEGMQDMRDALMQDRRNATQ